MEHSPISARHGEFVDLGPCLVGRNLNLVVLRGFAPADVLAEISSPDVYDMVKNQFGTQRDLKKKHSQECYVYAMESTIDDADNDPRAFPEIILNIRDTSVMEVYDLADTGSLVEVTSTTAADDL